MRFLFVAGIVLSSPLYTAFGSAISVDQIVVFGDSLSDNGNAAAALGGQFSFNGSSNYAANAATDGIMANLQPTTPAIPPGGPVGLWVDQLAKDLAVPDPEPFVTFNGTGLSVNPLGNNFAVASALTGSNPAGFDLMHPTTVPYTADQVGVFATLNALRTGSTAISPASLYTFWAGSNDLLDAIGTATTQAQFNAIATNAANNIGGEISGLAMAGGKNFLWVNLSPLGDTPLVRGAAPLLSGVLNTAAQTFDAQELADIAFLERTYGVNIIDVNTYALFEAIAANPGAYGFMNVTTPAQGLSVNPDEYLFWDAEHPTTAGGAAIANLAFDQVTATPEPGSWGFALFGCMGLAAVAIRKRQRKVLP